MDDANSNNESEVVTKKKNKRERFKSILNKFIGKNITNPDDYSEQQALDQKNLDYDDKILLPEFDDNESKLNINIKKNSKNIPTASITKQPLNPYFQNKNLVDSDSEYFDDGNYNLRQVTTHEKRKFCLEPKINFSKKNSQINFSDSMTTLKSDQSKLIDTKKSLYRLASKSKLNITTSEIGRRDISANKISAHSSSTENSKIIKKPTVDNQMMNKKFQMMKDTSSSYPSLSTNPQIRLKNDNFVKKIVPGVANVKSITLESKTITEPGIIEKPITYQNKGINLNRSMKKIPEIIDSNDDSDRKISLFNYELDYHTDKDMSNKKLEIVKNFSFENETDQELHESNEKVDSVLQTDKLSQESSSKSSISDSSNEEQKTTGNVYKQISKFNSQSLKPLKTKNFDRKSITVKQKLPIVRRENDDNISNARTNEEFKKLTSSSECEDKPIEKIKNKRLDSANIPIVKPKYTQIPNNQKFLSSSGSNSSNFYNYKKIHSTSNESSKKVNRTEKINNNSTKKIKRKQDLKDNDKVDKNYLDELQTRKNKKKYIKKLDTNHDFNLENFGKKDKQRLKNLEIEVTHLETQNHARKNPKYNRNLSISKINEEIRINQSQSDDSFSQFSTPDQLFTKSISSYRDDVGTKNNKKNEDKLNTSSNPKYQKLLTNKKNLQKIAENTSSIRKFKNYSNDVQNHIKKVFRLNKRYSSFDESNYFSTKQKNDFEHELTSNSVFSQQLDTHKNKKNLIESLSPDFNSKKQIFKNIKEKVRFDPSFLYSYAIDHLIKPKQIVSTDKIQLPEPFSSKNVYFKNKTETSNSGIFKNQDNIFDQNSQLIYPNIKASQKKLNQLFNINQNSVFTNNHHLSNTQSENFNKNYNISKKSLDFVFRNKKKRFSTPYETSQKNLIINPVYFNLSFVSNKNNSIFQNPTDNYAASLFYNSTNYTNNDVCLNFQDEKQTKKALFDPSFESLPRSSLFDQRKSNNTYELNHFNQNNPNQLQKSINTFGSNKNVEISDYYMDSIGNDTNRYQNYNDNIFEYKKLPIWSTNNEYSSKFNHKNLIQSSLISNFDKLQDSNISYPTNLNSKIQTFNQGYINKNLNKNSEKQMYKSNAAFMFKYQDEDSNLDNFHDFTFPSTKEYISGPKLSSKHLFKKILVKSEFKNQNIKPFFESMEESKSNKIQNFDYKPQNCGYVYKNHNNTTIGSTLTRNILKTINSNEKRDASLHQTTIKILDGNDKNNNNQEAVKKNKKFNELTFAYQIPSQTVTPKSVKKPKYGIFTQANFIISKPTVNNDDCDSQKFHAKSKVAIESVKISNIKDAPEYIINESKNELDNFADEGFVVGDHKTGLANKNNTPSMIETKNINGMSKENNELNNSIGGFLSAKNIKSVNGHIYSFKKNDKMLNTVDNKSFINNATCNINMHVVRKKSNAVKNNNKMSNIQRQPDINSEKSNSKSFNLLQTSSGKLDTSSEVLDNFLSAFQKLDFENSKIKSMLSDLQIKIENLDSQKIHHQENNDTPESYSFIKKKKFVDFYHSACGLVKLETNLKKIILRLDIPQTIYLEKKKVFDILVNFTKDHRKFSDKVYFSVMGLKRLSAFIRSLKTKITSQAWVSLRIYTDNVANIKNYRHNFNSDLIGLDRLKFLFGNPFLDNSLRPIPSCYSPILSNIIVDRRKTDLLI